MANEYIQRMEESIRREWSTSGGAFIPKAFLRFSSEEVVRVLSRDAFRPQFTEEDAERFATEIYGVEGGAHELPSERDQNFRIEASSHENYVLKIAAASESFETVQLQNLAMSQLQERLKDGRSPHIVPAISGLEIEKVVAADGTSHFVRMVSFLQGRLLAEVNPHTDELLFDFGRFVGAISKALEGWSSSTAKREFYWDLFQAPSVIEKYLEHITELEDRHLILYYLEMFKTEVLPRRQHLRSSILHNDANDHNVIVRSAHVAEERSFGILDFGDMVASSTVFEVAIASAYTMLDKPNPLRAAAQVVSGYNSVYELFDEELEVIFPCICTRLAMSVVISAYQGALEPDNEYLFVSQKDAWNLLRELKNIHPRFAMYLFREACGLDPCPVSQSIVNWLQDNQERAKPVLKAISDPEKCSFVDLSIGSLLIPNPDVVEDDSRFSRLIQDALMESGAEIGIGPYSEPRLIYTTDQYRQRGEYRTIHLGVDLFCKSGTSVFAAFDGVIHSTGTNRLPRDNGPTIVVEHNVGKSGPVFYTLYAHLSSESLKRTKPGAQVRAGQRIGEVGPSDENGGWPPHLHIQLVVDMLDMEGDFTGVASPSQLTTWQSVSPNPNMVLGLPNDLVTAAHLPRATTLKLREAYIGPSLSIAYRKHLKIVRGYMQYLYDEDGHKYLDAVNNVPHVGHSNPRVVSALSSQAAVLNTNTRYLHDMLVLYAKKLCAKLPEPLRVCFFVSSGSEANELALRLARTHTGRKNIIVIDGAYHGSTGELVNLSPYKFRGPGGKGLQPHVHMVRMPDPYRGDIKGSDKEAAQKYAMDVKDAADEDTAAFICEPIMGCGGQIVFPDGYLKVAFQHIREAGGVCIVDEVQTGFGRVGSHFWAFETQDVVPDIVTLGKPIGNGHPLGAVVTTREIAKSFDNGMEFFSTTGGNPVSCAVGLAVLDEIESRNLQRNALEIGEYLMDRLRSLTERHKVIGDIRGRGLFIGVELVMNRETLEPLEASYVINRMKDLGVLVSSDGPLHNVIKIKPPLVFTKENADKLVDTLDRVLSEDLVALEYKNEGG